MKRRKYDIFLSHSFSDREEVLQAKVELEQCGYTVFVDWIEAPELDRSSVSKETVNWLRENMHRCASLFFATSKRSPHSKWMPWELGYMDAFCGRVFVFPLDKDVVQGDTGQEYLDVYPVIDRANLREYLKLNATGMGKHDEALVNRLDLGFLGNQVPKWEDVGPIPPAGGEDTDMYREWFQDNALRLASDPYVATKVYEGIWRAWLRLWGVDQYF